MRKSISVVALVLLSTVIAAAQDVPMFETFAGFTYMRANSATNVPAFSMNGGHGEFVYNFNKWIGAVMDMGAVHNGNISDISIDTTLSNYLFGPRVSLRYSRIRPYFQMLLGGAHASTSIPVSLLVPPDSGPQASNPIYIPGLGNLPVGPGQPVTARLGHSQTAFAYTLGGGLDIKINKWVSFRPIALEWMLTRLQNIRSLEDHNQHHLRYSTGFNFTLGAR
jgi:opacity protein-like surface antigen